MKKPSEMDLASLSLEELMQGIEAVSLAASTSVDNWVESEGYFPGTTRVQAQTLYDKYAIWLEANPEAGRRYDIKSWGKLMSAKFKRGRSKYGSHYYISRREAHSFEP